MNKRVIVFSATVALVLAACAPRPLPQDSEPLAATPTQLAGPTAEAIAATATPLPPTVAPTVEPTIAPPPLAPEPTPAAVTATTSLTSLMALTPDRVTVELLGLAPGCRFRARCPMSILDCGKPVVMTEVGYDRQARCVRAHEVTP